MATPASSVHYRFAELRNHRVFYRDAGPRDAPDLPGFGFTVSPVGFEHTFDHLAGAIGALTSLIGMNRYAMYVFDYGAPVGLRLALEHPDRVTALITQNGNAYEEGIGDVFDPIREYWREPSAKQRSSVTSRGRKSTFTKPATSPSKRTRPRSAPPSGCSSIAISRSGRDPQPIIDRELPGPSGMRRACGTWRGALSTDPYTNGQGFALIGAPRVLYSPKVRRQ